MSKPEILIQEIMHAIKSVPVERLNEVLDFLKVLSRDPVDLSAEELEELRRARKEITEGKYVTLEELEREL